jgi:hypothetical protein
VTVYVHDLTSFEVPFLHIKRVKKQNATTIKDSSIAVVQSVDSGVELIVAADGG